MKRLLALALTLGLCISLAACEGTKKTTAENNPRESELSKTDEGDEKKEDKKDKATNEKISPMKLMQNVHARRAIAMGFDKTYITDVILKNGSNPVNYLVPAGLSIGADGEDFRAEYPDGFLPYDPDVAKKEWDLAKKELGFETIEVEFLTYDNESTKKISEFIQGQLAENLSGLKLSINQQPFKQKINLGKKGKFQLEYAGWSPDYPDAMTFLDMFLTDSGHNSSGYSNPDYDNAIKRAESKDIALNEEKRRDILRDAERILLEDAVIMPIYQRGRMYLQRPYVKGIIKHAYGTDYTYKHASTEIETDGKRIIRLSASSDIPSMDTNKSTDLVSFEILGNVFEGLVMLGEGDKIVPGVAKTWDVSEDGLTYTFHLREAKWSNGDALVAQDFVDSWRRLADKNTGAQYADMVETAGILNATEVIWGEKPVEDLGVEAIDEHTLKVSLSTPVPYFIKLMTLPSFFPINKSFVDRMGDSFGTSVETLVFNGAYTLSEWNVGYGYAMSKNPSYWDAENVKNDGVSYRIVKEDAAAVAMYDKEEIDKVIVTGEYVDQRKDRPDFIQFEESSVYYLVANINNSPGNLKN